jgi:hypothetical protein
VSASLWRNRPSVGARSGRLLPSKNGRCPSLRARPHGLPKPVEPARTVLGRDRGAVSRPRPQDCRQLRELQRREGRLPLRTTAALESSARSATFVKWPPSYFAVQRRPVRLCAVAVGAHRKARRAGWVIHHRVSLRLIPETRGFTAKAPLFPPIKAVSEARRVAAHVQAGSSRSRRATERRAASGFCAG